MYNAYNLKVKQEKQMSDKMKNQKNTTLSGQVQDPIEYT
jgi:hypothetical protein